MPRSTGLGEDDRRRAVPAARYFDQGPRPARTVLGAWRGAVFVSDICEKPLAASDYLKLAHDYHTIMVDRIPAMDYADRDAAKRFITLIDTLYDNAVKLMASAAADPLSLYVATEGMRPANSSAPRRG